MINHVPTWGSIDGANSSYNIRCVIYLDERDNRTPDMRGSVSDGFGEESCFLDFPTRDRKTVLHVRRRRWTILDQPSLWISTGKYS